ncbi:pancreatic triacylglycerol lipase-like [Lytechinus variegatus]|uniref:pancreatic triacylglycerol lipase-like n=1 Tax=Lytechinus variegatus TaxID=7654 RepID=UPI001BB14C1F|nr:pancreatic triacylglycerol lipase-like [Lytechinus variegatus]
MWYLAILFTATLVAGREVCYEQIGCLVSDEYPFYHAEDRPVDHLPESRAELGTTFRLRTRDLQGGYQELSTYDEDTIYASDFKPWKKTKVIIHGFVAGSDVDWMDDMTNEILIEGDYNVITIDWRPGVIKDDYDVAVGNVRVVGAEIAYLFDMIQRTQAVGPNTFHIIGHSLGAHAAGIAGAIVPNIGRITGLDPAGPYFDDCDPRVRLDASDADFVDVIHTDTDPLYKLGLGMYSSTGHVDFYPNSGRAQPGCDLRIIGSIFANGRIWGGVIDYIACNHIRAVYLFMDSINPGERECPYLAFECTREWSDYNEGLCFEDTPRAQMGWKADQYAPEEGVQELVFQENTLAEDPYCGFQYRFGVYIDDGRKAEKFKGMMTISLVGDNGQTEDIALSPDYRFYDPLTKYLHMGVSSHHVINPSHLYLEWDYDAAFYAPWKWEFIERPELFIHRIEVDSAESEESYLMCGTYDPIEPDVKRAFFRVTVCD